MATILNTVVCDDISPNTGIPDCAFDPRLIRGSFMVPRSLEIPASAFASEQALFDFLSDAVTNPKATRVYPLPQFKAITDGTADVTNQTSGYGDIAVGVKPTVNDWTFEISGGSICINNQLQKFNNTTHVPIFYDDNGTFIATTNAAGDGAKGIPCQSVYVYDWKAADGTNQTIYRIRFVYFAKYVNKFIKFALMPTLDLSEIAGILAVKVAVTLRATASANVIHVQAKTSCGNTDLHDLYATELAAANMWEVVNTLNGNGVTITSVASETGGWALTLNASDPDYSLVASAMSVGLGLTATLAGAGVTNYESVKTLIPAAS